MTRFTFLLFLCLAPWTVSIAAEPSGDEALMAAQAFYDGYMKVLVGNGNAEAYVLKSERVTAGFKKAYKAFMKEPDSDPIICAQDYPDAGFTAVKPTVNGDAATVTLTSKDASFKHSFEVYLKRGAKGWQIAGTQDLLKPKG